MRRLRWVLIALSSLSLAGSRTLAYDLNIAGIPLIDAAIIVLLFASAVLTIRRHDLNRRTLLILIALAPVVLTAAIESAGQPNEQTLRLLMPFAVFGLALLPSQIGWQRSDLRWLLALPALIHFALNLAYLVINGSNPELTGIDQIRAVIFPDVSRADSLGLIYGFAFLGLADWSTREVRLTRWSIGAVIYLSLAGQTVSESKALVLGQALCALAALFGGIVVGKAAITRLGLISLVALAISFMVAPAIATWQVLETPTTTQTTPTTSQTTPTTTTNSPELLERFVIQGSEASRLDTWGDILRATGSHSRFLIGGNSSDTNLLLGACGFSREDYERAPRTNKCAVDNGFNDFPLQFAHNWVFTSYLYFGIIGVAALMILLYLSLRDSAAVFRLTPMGAAPAVFWLVGLTSVFFWSPFVLTHAAVATLAVNSLARQTKVETPARALPDPESAQGG